MSLLPFSTRFKWKHMGEITFVREISTEFLYRHRCVLLGSRSKLLSHTYWSIVLAPIYFSKLLKRLFEGRGETGKICLRPSNMVWLFIEIYWSVGEAIFIVISPICFQMKIKMIHEKDLKQNILWHCPFKLQYITDTAVWQYTSILMYVCNQLENQLIVRKTAHKTSQI